MLGLPPTIRACLFDLDGVLTRTATVHARAWKDTFDAFLRERADRTGEAFTPFDAADVYGRYVDGMPRLQGTRLFLAARRRRAGRGNHEKTWTRASLTVCPAPT